MPITTHDNEISAPKDTKIWRYMSKDKFESLLRDNSLFFCRADRFADPFEGSIPVKERHFRDDIKIHLGEGYTEEMKNNFEQSIRGITHTHKSFKRGIVVNCWHINQNESDAMWQLYLKDNEGVAISTSIELLYNSLADAQQRIGSTRVRYLKYESDIWYHKEEYPHVGYNLLIPLFHKRVEFKHENEFRLYYQIEEAIMDENYWAMQPNDKGVFIQVNVPILIQEVILAPTADDVITEKIHHLIKQHGYSFNVRKSALNSPPTY